MVVRIVCFVVLFAVFANAGCRKGSESASSAIDRDEGAFVESEESSDPKDSQELIDDEMPFEEEDEAFGETFDEDAVDSDDKIFDDVDGDEDV